MTVPSNSLAFEFQNDTSRALSKTQFRMNSILCTHRHGWASAILTALTLILFPSVSANAGAPGLDAPVAIGPFLNNHFPTAEPTDQYTWSVQETYNSININLPTHLMPYPGTNKLLCIAKEGRIFLFDDNATATVADTFLDLRGSVLTNSDRGMTWLVFHPQFGQAGSPNGAYVYVTYAWKPPAVGGVAAGNGVQGYWRVSRFTVVQQAGKPVADPASEQILIQQYDRHYWHDSGCMMFGPDGYLYIGHRRRGRRERRIQRRPENQRAPVRGNPAHRRRSEGQQPRDPPPADAARRCPPAGLTASRPNYMIPGGQSLQ